VIGWIVRLWTKHRLLAVRCVNRRTPSTDVAHDVDVIASVVMSLISRASPYRITHTRSPHAAGRACSVMLPIPTVSLEPGTPNGTSPEHSIGMARSNAITVK
jgi:hypothetical protein